MKSFYKILTYAGLLIWSILVVLLFVTATTYLQLIVAVILYPITAYFAIKIFSNKPKVAVVPIATVKSTPTAANVVAVPVKESEDVIDIDKRTFLKLVGTTGIFFFVSSLLGRRVDSLFLNQPVTENTTGTASSNSSPGGGSLAQNGYNISEIDDSGTTTYYGFTNKSGGWLIMREDTDSTSFRYAKGNVDFPTAWAGRTNLKYDYYYNLF